jgi:hypothetical protein
MSLPQAEIEACHSLAVDCCAAIKTASQLSLSPSRATGFLSKVTSFSGDNDDGTMDLAYRPVANTGYRCAVDLRL